MVSTFRTVYPTRLQEKSRILKTSRVYFPKVETILFGGSLGCEKSRCEQSRCLFTATTPTKSDLLIIVPASLPFLYSFFLFLHDAKLQTILDMLLVLGRGVGCISDTLFGHLVISAIYM